MATDGNDRFDETANVRLNGHAGPLLLAVGGSAGSLEPLTELLQALPVDLPAAVLVTMHLGDNQQSRLAEILARHCPMPTGWARHGEALVPSRVYVAPADHHLLIRHSCITLSSGPRVNRHRPSVDAMFVSVARASGAGAVAVVLSGALDDGAVGAALVFDAGGQVLIEDPLTAGFAGMPSAARSAVADVTVLKAHRLAESATTAVRQAGFRRIRTAHAHPTEAAMSMAEGSIDYLSESESRLTRMSCPECGGSLAQVDLARISYFRCHVGHQYGPQALASAQADASEAKLWSALAAIEEEAAFQRYLGSTRDASDPGGAVHQQLAAQLSQRARQLRDQVDAWSPLDGAGSAS